MRRAFHLASLIERIRTGSAFGRIRGDWCACVAGGIASGTVGHFDPSELEVSVRAARHGEAALRAVVTAK
jgi:hypothetical protein